MTSPPPQDPDPRGRSLRGARLLPAVLAGLVSMALVAVTERALRPEPLPGTLLGSPNPASEESWARLERLRSPISPLPAAEGLDPGRVALGGRLFHEPRLSRDGTISCASCHDLAAGGDDGRVTSVGVGGALGTINAPTVFNASLGFRQFWDGRAATLEEQIDGPIQHPGEMQMTWPEVVARLTADPEYAAAFQEGYGEGPTSDNIKDALATFERSLVTTGSPFDRFLLGEEEALLPQARAGWELFQRIGCTTCHQGVNAGGSMFQTFGTLNDYFADKSDLTEADLGRFNVTGEERDRHRFKVPTLRNIAQTAPYFHDGSAATLAEAVQSMALYQLGQTLTDRDLGSLLAFLESLTGELPASALPFSGPR